MNTIMMISKEVAKIDGYKAGNSAKEFRNANPEGAKQIARLIAANMDSLIKEISSVVVANR